MTLRMMRMVGPEGFVLWGRAMGLPCGGLTRKERRDRRFRRVGDIEWDGGIKVGTPMPNDRDYKHALLDVEGGPSGITIPARITAVGWFARPPLPTPPNTNIGLPHSTQLLHAPQSRPSPVFYVGEHDPAMRCCLWCPCCWVSLPHPHPHLFCPIPNPTVYLPPPSPRHTHFRCRGIQWQPFFWPETMPSLSNGYWDLPGPLLHPTGTLSCPTIQKLFAWMYRDTILLLTTPRIPAVDARAHHAHSGTSSDDSKPVARPSWHSNPFVNLVRSWSDSDPLNPQGPNYEWPKLNDIDQEILSPHRTAAWKIRQNDFDAWAGWPHKQYPWVNMGYYLATERGDQPLGRRSSEGTFYNSWTLGIASQIHENQDWSLFPTSAGNRVQCGIHARTLSEQIWIEADLNALAILEHEQMGAQERVPLWWWNIRPGVSPLREHREWPRVSPGESSSPSRLTSSPAKPMASRV